MTKREPNPDDAPYRKPHPSETPPYPPKPQPKLAKKNKKTGTLTSKSDKPYGQPEKASIRPKPHDQSVNA